MDEGLITGVMERGWVGVFFCFFWKADQKEWRETEGKRKVQRVCKDEAILSLSAQQEHTPFAALVPLIYLRISLFSCRG